MELSPPSIAYGPLVPMLLVFGAGLVGMLVEAYAPQDRRRVLHLGITVLTLAAALVAVVVLALAGGGGVVTGAGALVVDGPALFLQGTLLLLALGATGLLAEQRTDSTGGAVVAVAATVPGSRADVAQLASPRTQTEVFPLLLFALGGMMVFCSTGSLLVMFIALEVLSLPLYLLAGLARRRRLLSQEAAVKYFLLGAFSSAFFLYGMALVYGYAGSVDLSEVLAASRGIGSSDLLLVTGLALLLVGLFFKVGAAPFHVWTPDVYQGSPTPVTALMAAMTKVAAFGALLRVLYVAFADVASTWEPVLGAVAVATMLVGSVLAVTQSDVKRMLAYSSVAHAGYLLVGVAAVNPSGVSATLFYLLTYGFATIGSFAVVTLVRDGSGEATHLRQWQGLGRTSPLVAGVFALFLLALAGIPLTSGFVGKFAVFAAALEGGAVLLVVVGVLSSAVAAFFYARVIVVMFFTEPAADAPTVAVPSVWTTGALAAAVVVTVALGVVPGPVLDLADAAGVFVR